MNFQLSTAFSSWFIAFCLLAGVIYTGILYFKNDFYSERSIWSWPHLPMMIFRFLSVSLIAFFLLNPFIKKQFRHIEKPIVVFGVDNSLSMIASDSATFKTDFPVNFQKIVFQTEQKFKVKTYLFDENISDYSAPTFTGKNTDIARFFEYSYDQFADLNPGAIVLFTDGNYNSGLNPVNPALNLGVPVYVVAMGDTAATRDLKIVEPIFNSIAYKGNLFPVKVRVKAELMKGETATINLLKNGKLLDSKDISITENSFETETGFLIEATETGLQKYSITVASPVVEKNKKNNLENIYVEVLENKKKLLFLAEAPHPDISALKETFVTNRNYELESYLVKDFLKKEKYADYLKNFDVVFLHQLPSENYPVTALLNALEKNRLPQIYIIGNKTSIGRFSQSQAGFQIIQRNKTTNEAAPAINPDFGYFNVDPGIGALLTGLSPVVTPFGTYRINLPHQVLLYQKIGIVTSDLPLWVFVQDLDVRKAYICGEGIWRWPLLEFKETGQQKGFDKLLYQSVQYVAAKGNKRRFFLHDFKKEFFENQEIIFEAELYNESFEFKNGATIHLRIFNEQNKSYKFDFVESGGFYKANAGSFPKGNYRFAATAPGNLKELRLTGEFTVKENNMEFFQTRTNLALLNKIAGNTGGRLFYPNELSQLADSLIARTDLKPISYTEIENKDLIHFKVLFFIILLLLSAEWFFRKYFGRY